jgi:S1-C subfamily serine protease
MKKAALGGLALVSLVVLAFVLAPRSEAQQRDRIVPPVAPVPFPPLEGPGASIGISIRDQAATDASGVLIESVEDNTPAKRAGLQKGDVVVEFDGERTRSARQFTRLVRETPPGRTVKMTILRGGSRQMVDITPEVRDITRRFPDVSADVDRALRAFPRDFNFDFDIQRFTEGSFGSSRRLGVAVSPMSDQLATYFGVKEGVLISEVYENTPAATAGLKAGDVVTAANGRNVMSVADLTREVRDTQPGGTIDLRVTRDRKELALKVTLPERRRPVTIGAQAL